MLYFTTGGGLVAIATAGLGLDVGLDVGVGLAATATGTAGGGGAAIATGATPAGATPNGPGGTSWFEAICCCISVSRNRSVYWN